MFTHENSADTPSFGDWHLGISLSTITVTIEDIWNQLCRLKPHKFCGLDNCHPRVLLELKEGLVKPLHMIFSISLRDGVLPTLWKKATVTAIHKKGNRNLPNNYRPLSLMSIVCKMLETIVKDRLMMYLTSCNLLSLC